MIPRFDWVGLYRDHVAEISRRYSELLARHGFDAAVIYSGRETMRRPWDDQYWPFLPSAHFAQWTPLAHPNCAVVVEPGKRPKLWRQVEENFWEKRPEPDAPGWQEHFDLAEAPSLEKLERPKGRVAAIAESAPPLPSEIANPRELLADLDRQRARKTPYEVACVHQANLRAAPGHQQIGRAYVDGDLTELQLHLTFLAVTEQDDWETPYKNILATGPNAATLHHVAYLRASHGDRASALLVDAGATWRGYASDISRTHVRGGGEAADRFRALVAAVDAMQRRLVAAVAVGLDYEELHDRSHREMAGVLVEAGLWKGSAEEAVAKGVTRAFYPHGLGHSLGLQTHDVGCAVRKPRAENPYLRNTSTIEAGQIFTIEPGLYFIQDLLRPINEGPLSGSVDWGLVENLWRFGGIRIEDDIAVTADGVRDLTREALEN